MTIVNYCKYSDHSDRWILWDVDSENLAAPANETLLTGPQFQERYGLSQEEEYNARFGCAPGTRDKFEKLDTDFRTNPALFYPGESSDVASGRFYSRPVPATANQNPPRPA
jgi:hypothetical protein